MRPNRVAAEIAVTVPSLALAKALVRWSMGFVAEAADPIPLTPVNRRRQRMRTGGETKDW